MISLILSLTDAPAGVPRETRYIETDSYSVGRDPDNDWILADPARRISRHHCLFSRIGEGWAVADLSRNGIIHAQGRQGVALSRDRGACRLVSGDRLRLGEYEISVTVQEDESSFRIMPLPDFIADLRREFSRRSVPSPMPAADRPAPRPSPRPRSGPERGEWPADPLLELLGLAGALLPPERRSVILFRLGASMDAALRGMRRLSAHLHQDGSSSGPPFLGESYSTAEALGWIAGTARPPGLSPAATPERLIGDAFEDLQRRHLCRERAYRRCLREFLDMLDPQEVENPAGLRQRHQRLRDGFNDIVDELFATAYRDELEKSGSGPSFAGRASGGGP
ncbi:FHA domain-containing protein [Acidomonas methanolica]|uniref:FHA domain-containing protein n=1 Tax=Acidomonas methanolica NBRC 104435 TaxID=1231351 RepID=A0A023D9G6_ACIMT|nr:FHA domain-containing protein [Acidomonas methanolica]MBU2652783.1 FHA domain-containing protein [Acidomonas methanolica]TCS31186.1 FHA domain-containing protein [Acidomonas methanolica]GAJ30461.1 hypothetical protein Amme_138_005 [Acidomonas methanolica NBRC 104435]GBQ49774.1 hypothetical protein AA0498_1067 [Acidomonas methanolica]GEK98566.1 hypothetical protein AME01nite_10650 [Acidomonas methanolica NBRC 104435]